MSAAPLRAAATGTRSSAPSTPTHHTELATDVVIAFTRGSTDALRAVFDRYRRPAFSVILSVLRDTALAEDALQEAFMRAWRSAERFDPSRPLAPWLFAIARRTAIDVLRREMRPTRGAHEPPEDGVTPGPSFVSSWLIWEVRSAIDQLPDEEATVVRLSHLEEMTHTEIATALGIPMGTVKSRSHRAHRKLAAILAHLDETEGGGNA